MQKQSNNLHNIVFQINTNLDVVLKARKVFPMDPIQLFVFCFCVGMNLRLYKQWEIIFFQSFKERKQLKNKITFRPHSWFKNAA